MNFATNKNKLFLNQNKKDSLGRLSINWFYSVGATGL